MASKIQLRRDTAANWTTTNPVLAQGEPGVELDSKKLKIGDGTTAWATLPYASGGSDTGALIYKGATDVTAAPPSAPDSGWVYVISTGGVPNAGWTGLAGNIPVGTSVFYNGTSWATIGAPAAASVWTRSGTELTPATAGDSVFTTGAVKVGGTTAAPNVQLKADGGIVANTDGLVYDAATKRLAIGTTSASYLLDAAGDAAVGIGAANSNNHAFRIRAGTSGLARIIAADTSDAGYIDYDHSGNSWIFRTSGSEACRIDSSQRLLLGTSSALGAGDGQYSLLQIRGNSSSSSAGGGISLSRGEAATSISAGESLGQITFTDNGGGIYATVSCEADAAAGTNDFPGRLTFSTCPSGSASLVERMLIRSTGSVRTFASGNCIVASDATSAGTSSWLFQGRHSATAVNTGTPSVVITSNGDVTNTNNSYGAISDAKLKENIVDAKSQWDDMKALQVRNYNLKAETGQQTHTQIGLVAQEAELVSPGLVSESPDRDEEGNDLGTVTKSVNYSVLYMKAVKALQEAMERIETLEAKVAALEAP